MSDRLADELDRLYRAAGLKRLSPVWAKLEIILGLAAAGGGLMFAMKLATSPPADAPPERWAAALGLFVAGGYLAMAGHRSHLYQSNNRLAAYLAATTRGRQPTAPGDRS